MTRLIRFTALALLSWGATEARSTEILWDRYGIPHIYGDTAEDAFYGLGYAQMTNHAEWLLLNVAAARGRYAEYFGPGTDDEYVRSDEFVRSMDIERRSVEWARKGGAQQLRYVRAFIAGANAYATKNASGIAPRIRAVLPLRETDPFALWQSTLQYGFQSLGSRALAAEWLKADTTASRVGVEEPRRQGASNGWALGPAKTARGTTILVGNPHLDFGGNGLLPESRADDPGRGAWQWMQAHLVVGDPRRPTVNLAGVGFLGVPVISIGFNDHLAWTHTDNRAQTSNVYELDLQGDSYRWAGRWRPLTHRVESIRVCPTAGACEERAIDVASSVHGPVIARKPGKALALRVAGTDAAAPFAQYWDMGSARSLAQFESAYRRLQMPYFNVIYADEAGRIMMADAGRIPMRHGGAYDDYSGVLDGADPKLLWTRTFPWSALPRIVDPPSGFLQNGKDSPWTSTFPAALRRQDFPGYMSFDQMWLRAQSAASLLVARGKFSYEDAVGAKLSTRMLLADRLLPELLAEADARGDEGAKAAARVLKRWDRTSDHDSRGSVLFVEWWQTYEERCALLAKDRGVSEPAFARQYDPARPLETPTGLGNTALAIEALSRAAAAVVAEHGRLDVDWGEVNRVVLVSRDADFRNPKPIADVPANGSEDSVGIVAKMNYGPTGPDGRRIANGGEGYVQVVEFTSSGVRAGTLLVYGNASRPGSPHIADQLPAYVGKRLIPSLRSLEEVERDVSRREVLPQADSRRPLSAED